MDKCVRLITKIMVKEKRKFCIGLLCVEMRHHEKVEEKSVNHSVI